MSDDEGYGRGEERFVGNDVKGFVLDLAKAFLDTHDEADMADLYDIDYNNITEKYYKASVWPVADAVAPLVRDDENFLYLYKELYFRHIYSRLKPSLDDRFDSFQNYISLFNIILGLTTDDPELLLPANWLWDIIDEFVYQFRSFHKYRTAVKSYNEEEEDMELLRDHPHVWSAQTVIRYLHALIKKSGIDITSIKEERKPQPAEGISQFFKTLGEFSLIGLSRVLCLLSDYSGALQALDPIEHNNPLSPFQSVTPARASMAYFKSFSYLMSRRYQDATRASSDFITWLSRNRHTIPRSYQTELIDRKSNQILGVLAMAVAFCPQMLEDSLETKLTEKFGEKLWNMARGHVYTFDEVFEHTAPRFISTCPPDYDDNDSKAHMTPLQLQRKILSRELRQREQLPEVQNYLKMCTSMSAKKLAKFLNVEESTLSTYLLNARHKSRGRTNNGEEPASEGDWQVAGKMRFYITKDMVHVSETEQPKRYGDHFIGQITQMNELIYTLRSTPIIRPPLK